jgi:hypothetical protein
VRIFSWVSLPVVAELQIGQHACGLLFLSLRQGTTLVVPKKRHK